MRHALHRTLGSGLLVVALGAAAAGASAQSPSSAASPAPATASPGAVEASPAPTPIVGPRFPGTLVQAIPPLVNGAAVTVQGPATVDFTTDGGSLGKSVQQTLSAVGATTLNVAFGMNDNLIISAIQVPGADSTALDAALVTALEADTGNSAVRVEAVAGRAVHAFDSLAGTQYAWVNGDILFWVLGPDGAAIQAVSAMPGSSVPLVPGGAAPQATTVQLIIGSGPDAGTYDAVLDSGGCSTGAFGPDQYGLQYSTTDPAVAFSSLQVIIEKGKAAAKPKGSDAFSAFATVNGTDYTIDPGNRDGTGKVHVTVAPAPGVKAVYTISGKTKAKVPVEATVACATLIDFGD